ncbi:MAG TPA: hypothetical protein VN782_12195 [Usitatibacter sp.]|nr:hypothetical protein [Usitatibacter sp.]
MQGFGWQELLDVAETEAKVIAIARNYLASIEPFEVARLPERCKPRKLLTAEDIGAFALDLVREHGEEMRDAAPLVHRMAAFFAHANLRLSHILTKANDDESGLREIA